MLSQSVVGEFNCVQRDQDHSTNSNYAGSVWLRQERPKHAIYPHQKDYCDTCAKVKQRIQSKRMSNLGPTLESFVQTWDSHLGPLFKPGTHTWVLCSSLGPTLGSPIQTRAPYVGHLFKPGTHPWVLRSNLGSTPGSPIQTWDPHLGHLFKPGTHTWVPYSNLEPPLGSFVQTSDPHLGPIFKPGPHTWSYQAQCLQVSILFTGFEVAQTFAQQTGSQT